jgi:hypothetical protein
MQETNKSIINWELHQKFLKKKKIEKDFKYKKYKKDPNKKKSGFFKRALLKIKSVFYKLINTIKNGKQTRL